MGCATALVFDLIGSVLSERGGSASSPGGRTPPQEEALAKKGFSVLRLCPYW